MPKVFSGSTTGSATGAPMGTVNNTARRRARRRHRAGASTATRIQQYSTPRAAQMWGGNPQQFSENLYGLLKSQRILATGATHEQVAGLINFAAFGQVSL